MPRTDPYTQKIHMRKSVKYYLPGKTRGRDLYASSYTRMFIEDMYLGVMPIGGRSENPNFVVRIDPPCKKVEELIKSSLPTRYGKPSSLTEAVCDFISEALHTLAYYGKAYYEVVYCYADGSKNEIESFMIEKIANSTIKDTFGFCWQFIPREVLEEKEETAKRFIWLPKEDLLVLSIPRVLGGNRKFKRMLSELQWLSACIIPGFARKDMAVKQQTKGYDFSIYRANQETFLARMTRHLGWTARQSFSERSLEIYQIYRLLKFEKTKAILREYILHKLNESLKIIGKGMKFNAKIRLEGMPSPQDYDNYMKRLIDGSLQFSEAFKLMRV